MLGALRSNISDPVWTGVTFQNSFANLSGLDATYQDVQYSLFQGKVEIRGACYKNWPFANNIVIFNLPVGFRPTKRHTLYLPSAWTGNAEGNFRVDVLANGDVTVIANVGPTTGICYPLFNCSFFLV